MPLNTDGAVMLTCRCGSTEFLIQEISLGRVEVCLECGEQEIILDEV